MNEEEEISIDEIKLWNVEALKSFLRSRKLKISGRKEELVALVYAAKKMPELVPMPSSPATKELSKQKGYEDLLKTPHGMLPDPRTITDWESETNSVSKWPPTMAIDIGNYLRSVDDISLGKRLMADYKDQKAYSYFASGWMGEVEYHGIDENNVYCFLRSKCIPSQHVRDVPWNVWVAVEKKSGHVHSAFCTCFAGYSTTCNHVAALLFKVDFAWRNGVTNPACTSRPCEWSAFAGKKTVEPKRVADLTWSKPKFSKQDSVDTNDGINPKVRKLFSPLSTRSNQPVPSSSSLVAALYCSFKDACAFEYVNISEGNEGSNEPYADYNVDHNEEVVGIELPLSLPALAKKSKSASEFLETLPTYSEDSVTQIEQLTLGQSGNNDWFEHRKGRITGSIAHSVMTKERSRLKGDKEISYKSLSDKILGMNVTNPCIPALKYGREMEEEARKCYESVNKTNHKGLQVKDCGLFVCRDHIYLGASPDGLIKCQCCGDGLLEIKCPYSIAHTEPSHTNLDFITSNNHLKSSHTYYSQIQHQLGVTRRKWCDLFVYSRHGHLTIRVPFDEERWNEIKNASEYIFVNKLANELVHM